jgi:hypothetical protein
MLDDDSHVMTIERTVVPRPWFARTAIFLALAITVVTGAALLVARGHTSTPQPQVTAVGAVPRIIPTVGTATDPVPPSATPIAVQPAPPPVVVEPETPPPPPAAPVASAATTEHAAPARARHAGHHTSRSAHAGHHAHAARDANRSSAGVSHGANDAPIVGSD